MASYLLLFTNTFFILFLSSTLAVPSNPNLPSPANTSHEAICNSTPYPKECLSNLPVNQTGDTRELSRVFVRKSLVITHTILTHLTERHVGLSEPTVRALEDCHVLAETSLESIAKTLEAINFTNTIDASEAEELETLLSAVLTNQETCLEGLGEVTSSPRVRELLAIPLAVGRKLYSVSLALFKHGWVDDIDGYNSTNPSFHNRVLTSTATQRKLIQTTNVNGVLVSQTVVVNQNGTGNFTTISDAVNAAPNNTATMFGRGAARVNNTYFVIYVTRGVYEEYISIGTNKQNVMMIGDGINQTIITGNRSVVDGWTTFNSATFAVTGQGFIAVNITFRNTAGAVKHQAVALRNGADLSAFHHCSFEGYQDTLYAHSLRQFYRECDVYGTIDFIFGNAAVVLQNCNIFARQPLPNQFNAVTAQGRSDPNQNTGTSIHNCAVRASPDLAAAIVNATVNSTRTYLGRPWREYSTTVYMQSFIDGLVDPAGWREWTGNFALNTLYYAEFNNTGPGSDTTRRVAWPGYVRAMSAIDAVNFTASHLIAGDAWLLGTTVVPYTSGLSV